MTAITQDQAQKRFLTIPPTLQDALFSVETTQVIDQITNKNHLSGHRADALANAVGWVLLGFLHPEEVRSELESAGVPPQAAQEIANETNEKIFKAFGADLEKTYAPLKEGGGGPMVIQDVNAPAAFSVKMSGQIPTPKTNAASPAVPPPNSAPAAPKPNTLSDVGWSKTQSSGPVVKLDASLVPPPAPAAPQIRPQQRPATPAPSVQHGPVMGEFERLSGMKKAPGDTAPVAPEPAPVMLHEDTTFTASGKNTSFTLSKPGGAEVPIPTGKQSPGIPKPAVLEFSSAATGTPKSPSASQGVVHYTDYKAPLSSVPTANSGQRSVSEITAPKAPAPASTPVVPPVSNPPTPPAPPAKDPQEKVIVKNFL